MLYASPYEQDFFKYTAYLCVSVPTSMTQERCIHVEIIAPPILEDGHEIKDFAEVKLMGSCDRSCHQDHPGQIRKMFRLGEKLAQAMILAEGYEEAVGQGRQEDFRGLPPYVTSDGDWV